MLCAPMQRPRVPWQRRMQAEYIVSIAPFSDHVAFAISDLVNTSARYRSSLFFCLRKAVWERPLAYVNSCSRYCVSVCVSEPLGTAALHAQYM